MTNLRMSLLSLLLGQLAACSFEAERDGTPGLLDPSGGTAGMAGAPVAGDPLTIDVGEDEQVFVKLAPLGEWTPIGDPRQSSDWDLLFTGWDVFTNSGASGAGSGGGFGPLGRADFFIPLDPVVPFVRADETSGVFRDWYAYEGTTHSLWSRYHVYGVRSGERLYKLQLLGYYGELEGAPVSALYALRYAEITAAGSGEVRTVVNLDATAGGPSGTAASPSGCLDLASGEQLALAPDAARASTAWQICFRRDTVSVNGELGGPGDVQAVDVHLAETAAETLDTVKGRTAETERARFDEIDAAALGDPSLAYRGDRVVSVFSDAWVDRGADPPAPAEASWFVTGADGASRFLILFESIEESSAGAMGRVTFRVRALE